MKFTIGSTVVFREKMFKRPFKPYYDKYKGHTFKVSHYHPDPEAEGHLWLICQSDPNIKLDGYIEETDIIIFADSNFFNQMYNIN